MRSQNELINQCYYFPSVRQKKKNMLVLFFSYQVQFEFNFMKYHLIYLFFLFKIIYKRELSLGII